MEQVMIKKDVLHYPQLDTVLMVENFIRDNSGEFGKRQLWEHLPKKVMYQTFCVIFDYLMDSGKIAADREGHIAWIWNPELVRKYLVKKHLMWRPEAERRRREEIMKEIDRMAATEEFIPLDGILKDLNSKEKRSTTKNKKARR